MIDNSLFSRSPFAEDAVIVTASGTKTVPVIFYNEYQTDSIIGIEISSSDPLARVINDSDMTGIKKSDKITIRSVEYKIYDIRPDGSGMTFLALRYDD